MENIFSNQQLVKLFTKRWKQIILITVAGTIIIGASTFLIKPKYKSTAIVYPSNLGKYSEESYTEQMFQILQSRDIADSVITKFSLDQHYGISKTDKHYKTKLYDYYFNYVSIQKTPYESIKISVLDTDPKLACDIVNEIIQQYNSKVRELHRVKIKEVITLYENQIADIEIQAKQNREQIEYLLQKTGKNDLKTIIELSKSLEEMSPPYAILNRYSSIEVNNPSFDLEQMTNFGPIFIEKLKLYSEQVRTLAKLKLELESQRNEYRKKITYANIISSPYIPDKKSTPLRGAISIIGGFLVFLTSIVVFSLIDKNNSKIE
ncbi:MAG TPA: Wzz/FepE/Etk N-terminal domain-containing protein [Salinivirgaceae bacterium]|nr:Wzz/FepE/Etk N-terminal domain-containing protein [Salinivirgaceae bacterium]